MQQSRNPRGPQPQSQQDRSSSLKYQLSSRKLINKIKSDLGMRRVKTTDRQGTERMDWELDEKRALLNKEGINNLLAIARSNIDKNTNLSEYQDKEIINLMKHLHHTLRKHLVRNWDEYGINDSTVATEILEVVTNPIFSAYKRALGGAEKELISKTISSKEVLREKESEKGGLGGFFLGGSEE